MGDNNLTNEDLNNVHVLDTNFRSIPSEENQAKLTPGGTIKNLWHLKRLRDLINT